LGIPPAQVEAETREQIAALRAWGGLVTYVKPHGALYHRMQREAECADAIVRAVDGLPVLGLDVAEGFADRGYAPDGLLVPRDEPGALLGEEAVAQALRLARTRERGVDLPTATRPARSPSGGGCAQRSRRTASIARVRMSAPRRRPRLAAREDGAAAGRAALRSAFTLEEVVPGHATVLVVGDIALDDLLAVDAPRKPQRRRGHRDPGRLRRDGPHRGPQS
jgi:hypothetical protein